MTNERLNTIHHDFLLNAYKPRTLTKNGLRMQYWIENGRYEIIGELGKVSVTIHIKDATLIATYTSRLTRDANIYKTCRRKSKPFIIVPASDSSAYSWRIPVTIHDN